MARQLGDPGAQELGDRQGRLHLLDRQITRLCHCLASPRPPHRPAASEANTRSSTTLHPLMKQSLMRHDSVTKVTTYLPGKSLFAGFGYAAAAAAVLPFLLSLVVAGNAEAYTAYQP